MKLAFDSDDIVVRLRCESRVRNGLDREDAATAIERMRAALTRIVTVRASADGACDASRYAREALEG